MVLKFTMHETHQNFGCSFFVYLNAFPGSFHSGILFQGVLQVGKWPGFAKSDLGNSKLNEEQISIKQCHFIFFYN